MQNNKNANGQKVCNERKGEKSMILSVANPLYDAVFKFLMEDERIAKIVLSALLKKEVVSVEMRRHEYPNVTRDQLSMFRIA